MARATIARTISGRASTPGTSIDRRQIFVSRYNDGADGVAQEVQALIEMELVTDAERAADSLAASLNAALMGRLDQLAEALAAGSPLPAQPLRAGRDPVASGTGGAAPTERGRNGCGDWR